MRLATFQITYDESLVGVDSMTEHLSETEGVYEVYEQDDRELRLFGSLSESRVPTTRWRVEDNVTGAVLSRAYDTKAVAENICGGMNTPDAGGRYGVYTNASGEWRRDLT